MLEATQRTDENARGRVNARVGDATVAWGATTVV